MSDVHAHCDHLDPYTLVRLWKELHVAPVLLLPKTLSFLVPVFQKYLQFINESIKSYIMLSKGYNNDLQEFIDKIMIDSALDKGIEINYNVLDIKTLKKILKDIYGKK